MTWRKWMVVVLVAVLSGCATAPVDYTGADAPRTAQFAPLKSKRPVIIRGTEYVDGGLASRVPAPVARAMGADIVIAVDVSWQGSEDAKLADVVIRPPTIRARITDFNHKIENMAAGEEAAREAIPRIRELIVRVASEKTRIANLGFVSVVSLAR